MNEMDLRKLKRNELLEIMLQQQLEIERLQKELEECRKQLEDRTILYSQAGNIASIAAQINSLMNAAQQTAMDYVKGVKASKDSGLL